MSWWDIPTDPQILEGYDLDEDHWLALCHILIITATFAFILSTFVCVSYALFKYKYPARLIAYFSFCTAASAVSLLTLSLSGGRVLANSYACTAQGAVNQFFSISTILWWVCISVNLYCSFVKNKKINNYEFHMHVICWGGALIASTAPSAAGEMKVVGLWCWIHDWPWQVLAYYAIMGACWVIGAGLWTSVIMFMLKMSKRYKSSDRSAVSVQVIRQAMFVLWFLVIFCFMFVHRIYIHATGKSPFPLMMMHVTAMASQGIFVFIVFGLRYEILWFWRNLITYRCCGKAGYESLE